MVIIDSLIVFTYLTGSGTRNNQFPFVKSAKPRNMKIITITV